MGSSGFSLVKLIIESQYAGEAVSSSGSSGPLELQWRLPGSDLGQSSFDWEGSGGCGPWCRPRLALQSDPLWLSPRRWRPSGVGQPAALSSSSCGLGFLSSWVSFFGSCILLGGLQTCFWPDDFGCSIASFVWFVSSAFCNFFETQISEHLLTCFQLKTHWHDRANSRK